jgi:uncharacterized protein
MSEAPETPEKEPDPGATSEGATGQPLGDEQPPKRRRAPRKRVAPAPPVEAPFGAEVEAPPTTIPPPPVPPFAATLPPDPPVPTPPPPPPPRVEEVEAIPLTRAETRGPAIEIPGTRHIPEPPPIPPSAVPPGGATDGGTTQPPPPPPPPPIAPVDSTPKPPSKFWVVVCHLSYLIPLYVPGLALTLLIWAWRRRRDAHLDDQAKEALNFQLTYTGLTLILSATCVLCVLVPVVWIVGAVLCVVAAVSAAEGNRYRYPYILRLIK